MIELDIKDEYLLQNEAHLRELCGDTTESIWAKAADFITEPMHKIIELSPFCCISSYDKSGKTDISPRGDAPGFVRISKNGELLIPDRPGNRRYDNIRNILETEHVSLLFMIPGISITLRVNGRAKVSFDPELLSRFEVKGKLPQLVIVVTVEEAYGHCAKAILRGKIWRDDYKLTAKDAPGLAELMSNHRSLNEQDFSDIDAAVIQDLKDSMY